MSGAAAQRGFTVLEVAVAAALAGLVALASVAALGGGSRASRESVARQVAAREASRLLEAIAREVQDASASTVVASSATPDVLTLRRVTGWDEIAGAPVLSPAVTWSTAPLALAAGASRLAVVRSPEGGEPSRLSGLVAKADASDPTLPGLSFALREADGTTLVDVAVTIDVPCEAAGAAVVRATTSVRLESR